MKLLHAVILWIFSVALLSAACDNNECKDNGWTVCRDGKTYWIDQCGNEVGRLADCECGCNDDFSDCKTPCGCIPSCERKCCGSDGCGGICDFDCSSLSQVCNAQTCRCEKECVGVCKDKECGDDGCGGSCGTCSGETEYCTDSGRCVDDCMGLDCGLSPNAGIDCGSCTGNKTCVAWRCSGQTWQDTPAGERMTWEQAIDYCDNLTLNGKSDWRLPSIDELRALILGCQSAGTGGECQVTNECLSLACRNVACGGCNAGEGPASQGCYWESGLSGECSWYWSSSEREDLDLAAWVVYFYLGSLNVVMKDRENWVRCVR